MKNINNSYAPDYENELRMVRLNQFKPLSIWDRLCLILGGPRRWLLSVIWPAYVSRQISKRQGECKCCGACCRMSWFCRNLEYENSMATCRIYNAGRKLVCEVFPVNEMDLADRNRVKPNHPCGFYWKD